MKVLIVVMIWLGLNLFYMILMKNTKRVEDQKEEDEYQMEWIRKYNENKKRTG